MLDETVIGLVDDEGNPPLGAVEPEVDPGGEAISDSSVKIRLVQAQTEKASRNNQNASTRTRRNNAQAQDHQSQHMSVKLIRPPCSAQPCPFLLTAFNLELINFISPPGGGGGDKIMGAHKMLS